MSNSQFEGATCYNEADTETRAWFERQWQIWPKRANERYTTNIAFHYGAIQAYRAATEREPTISDDLRGCIKHLGG